jgi:site-specific DNA-methyltransferase (adenine-specific)
VIQGKTYTLHIGNNLDILPTLPDNSVDSIVTDPPYELGFMGKKWDNSGIAYSVELWTQCLRVLKPGGHLLSFGGTRTWHRVAVGIEDAGFEVRDSMAWLYGSGFPKSLDVSKAIDKAAGVEREVVGIKPEWGKQAGDLRRQGQGEATLTNQANRTKAPEFYKTEAAAGMNNPLAAIQITAPATPEAQQWEGWGTALKPAFEPIVVARKPLIGTVAENVLTHGTGGLNIDGSRIGTEQIESGRSNRQAKVGYEGGWKGTTDKGFSPGRWPANVILDEYSAELLDEQSDASRFFYVAKASKRDRNEGLEGLPLRKSDQRSEVAAGLWAEMEAPKQNFHPTVKPTDLMRYLIKLITPPGGVVLDPFTGSGSTGKAAILEGFRFIGCELTEDYIPIIQGRLDHAEEQVRLAGEKKDEVLF